MNSLGRVRVLKVLSSVSVNTCSSDPRGQDCSPRLMRSYFLIITLVLEFLWYGLRLTVPPFVFLQDSHRFTSHRFIVPRITSISPILYPRTLYSLVAQSLITQTPCIQVPNAACWRICMDSGAFGHPFGPPSSTPLA